jgi:hypothetical protein
MSAFGGKSDTFCGYACAAGTSAIFRAQKTRWGKQLGKQPASHRNGPLMRGRTGQGIPAATPEKRAQRPALLCGGGSMPRLVPVKAGAAPAR